ncbi:MAG: glucose-1-phosphate thymidylyltransferase, partial [Candidatus Uhrbacteria bacterium]
MRTALITAGGRATRLRPITHTINKHLIPLAGKPMIEHVIEKVVAAGIDDIIINVNPGEQELQRVLGDGSRWNVRVRYVEQEGGPLGLAHIVRNAQPHIGDVPFLFILGDNLILGDLRPLVERFRKEQLDMGLVFARVDDPRQFGVGEFVDGKLVRIHEKPSDPPSNLAQTGIYCYSPRIFDAVRRIEPSARGEYEISDANSLLIADGARFHWEEMTGYWKDTGKPEDLLEGNQLLLSVSEFTREIDSASIDPAATIQGRVQIGEGTRIEGCTLIRGPVSIGRNCTIRGSYIGPYTSIGNGVEVMGTEVEHSIVFDEARIVSGKRIVDSIVGFRASVVPTGGVRPTGHRL